MAELDPLSADYDLTGLMDGDDDTSDHQRLIPETPEQHAALHEAWAGLDPDEEMREVRARYLAVAGQDGDTSSANDTYYGERVGEFFSLPSSDDPGGGFRGQAEHLAWDLRSLDALSIDVTADLTYLYGGDDPRANGNVPMEAVLERARENHVNMAAGLNLGGFSGAAAGAIDAAQERQPAAGGSGGAGGGNPDFAVDWQALGEVRNRLSRATEGIQAAVADMDDPVRNAVQRTSEADTDALEMTMGLSNMLLAAYYDLTVAAVKIGTGMATFTNAITVQVENYQQSQAAIEDLFEIP